MNLSQIILYKTIANDTILNTLTNSIDDVEVHDSINQLLTIATENGFSGNLWHCYVLHLIINDENIYSMACERFGEINGSLNDIVTRDFGVIWEFYNYSLPHLGDKLNIDVLSLLGDYTPNFANPFYVDLQKQFSSVNDNISFKITATAFYRQFGVGKIGLNKAFRIDNINGVTQIIPITTVPNVTLDDLIGCDIPKQQLVNNTNAFVSGKKANNCLLFGNAGTGKSTSIKALANQYYGLGLRIIEVYKHQFQYLGEIIEQIKTRNYRFIIYLDDLSFDEFEIEYKYLKAIIEGSLAKKPDNVIIYATSNRRHLVRELYSDRANMKADVHTTETMQEKLSLATRFGESIYFSSPTRKEFFSMVITLAKRNDIHLPDDQLIIKATKWEFDHSDQSGRTAQQFIDYLLGCQE